MSLPFRLQLALRAIKERSARFAISCQLMKRHAASAKVPCILSNGPERWGPWWKGMNMGKSGEAKKPIYKRVWFWILVVVILAAIGAAAGGSGGKDGDGADPAGQNQISADASADGSKGSSEASESQSQAEPEVPREYQSALAKAESYSELMHMSKQGIYDQLVSEYGDQFTPEAAQYAIDNLDADYKANALEKARSYQDTMDMSPAAIHDQLTSEYGEKFTEEEADYAIENL